MDQSYTFYKNDDKDLHEKSREIYIMKTENVSEGSCISLMNRYTFLGTVVQN